MQKINLNSNWLQITEKAHTAELVQGTYKEMIYGKIPDEISNGNFSDKWLVQSAVLPVCWENTGLLKGFTGPVWYRKELSIDKAMMSSKQRLILEFKAVSYYSKVWLNGKLLGEHKGMWTPFEFDITTYARPGINTLILEVHKPGDIFDTKASLAGFVPYVTSTFGGIWQDVNLYATDFNVKNLRVDFVPGKNIAELEFDVVNYLGKTANTEIKCKIGASTLTLKKNLHHGINTLKGAIKLNKPELWTSDKPKLQVFEFTLKHEKKAASFTIRTGLRTVDSDGSKILINGTPIYFRGILHWLSYTGTIAPIMSKDSIRREMLKVRKLGFNMVKLCLVIPSEEYFEVADELGMYIWLELPMWLPKVDEEFRKQSFMEYTEILKTARKHPSVVVYTLGCELNSDADEDFLKNLFSLAKDITGSKLIKDNSGSAEAYGGITAEFGDFYDYHFYAEANQFTELYNHFYPSWKERKPLLFGEYCDCDTFRSIKNIKEKAGYLWWTQNCKLMNPQGVRWDYSIVTNEQMVAKFSSRLCTERLKNHSYSKAVEYRKDIIEQTRKLNSTSGYVITGIIDTPLSTAGIIDDFGNLKYDSKEFNRFNRDSVLALDRGRRRIWECGGDRPQYLDDYNVWQGTIFFTNIILSYREQFSLKNPQLSWSFKPAVGKVVKGSSKITAEIGPGFNGKAGEIVLSLPSEKNCYEFEIVATLADGKKQITSNSWKFNALRKPDFSKWDFTLVDNRSSVKIPGNIKHNVKIASGADKIGKAGIVVFTEWDSSIPKLVKNGVKVILLCDNGAPFTQCVPFFREGVAIFNDEQYLKELAHGGYAGIKFKGVAPDRAFDLKTAEDSLGTTLDPVLTRIDNRTFIETHYMAEGKNIIVTTLRLFGGWAGQPLGANLNVLGAYLFDKLLNG